MPYYVLQVKTRGEDEYLVRAGEVFADGEGRLLWPRRNLHIRSKGKWRDELAPIFPGYLFLDAAEVTNEIFMKLRRIPGFFRFLQSNQNIIPLSSGDRELLMHFLSFGEIVDKSAVYFDENNRIKVMSGPLLGLEGSIVKVDRRKGRAKVKLDMFTNAFLVDFGFDTMEKT
jgi:transcription termination/antitermination protein NusG